MPKCKECGVSFVKTGQNQLFHDTKCTNKFFNRKNAIKLKKEKKIKNKYLSRTLKKNIRRLSCLNCDNIFTSEGMWNRICLICKNKSEFQYDIDIYTSKRGRTR